jgi:branched-chain amino acid transport system substrate-binding protein
VRLRALTIAVAAVVAVAGCGGSGSDDTSTGGDDLTVYSALPLQGTGAARSRDIVDGEKLALAEAGGKVGALRVSYRSLDDSEAKGGWQPGATVDAARAAAADGTTIAFLGDFDAGATALSLPTTNAADIVQVSPGATYDGFTGGPGSGAGEPDKYEPSGRRTFGRVAPTDSVQATAIASVLAGDGCRRVAVLSAPSAFDASLADLVADAARRVHLRVVLEDQVRTDPGAHRDAAAEVAQSGAQCAVFAGATADMPGDLLQAVHAADPALRFVLPMALADDDVARSLGAAAPLTVILGPAPPDTRFAAAFSRAFGRRPGPWAAYGHEAMRRALDAIRRAGDRGNDRRAVAAASRQLPAAVAPLALWRPAAGGLRVDRRLAP